MMDAEAEGEYKSALKFNICSFPKSACVHTTPSRRPTGACNIIPTTISMTSDIHGGVNLGDCRLFSILLHQSRKSVSWRNLGPSEALEISQTIRPQLWFGKPSKV